MNTSLTRKNPYIPQGPCLLLYLYPIKIKPLIHIHNAIYLLSVEIFCLKYLKNFRIEFLQIKMCFLKHMYNKKENIILINRELWMPAQLDLHFRFSDLQPQVFLF